MSWVITFIGNTENVVNALGEHSTKPEGQSKLEYDSALPYLIGLVKENFGNQIQVVKVNVSGYGYAANGEQKQRCCTAFIEAFLFHNHDATQNKEVKLRNNGCSYRSIVLTNPDNYECC